MSPGTLSPSQILFYQFIGFSFLLIIHIGAVLAVLNFNFTLFISSIIYWQITASLGISVCYHRYCTHKSYEVNRYLKCLLLFCGCLAGQLGPMRWTRVHRVHHNHADEDLDPHSPRHGFVHSHFGWLLQLKRRAKNPHLHKWPKDLLKDTDIVFFEKAFPWIQLSSWVAFYIVAGLDGVLWLGFFRICITLHSIWSINSFGHSLGYTNFKLKDDSRNQLIYALFAAGEPLHNNHHAHPNSAKFSVRPMELDIGWLYIYCFSKMGLMWNVKHYSNESDKIELAFIKKLNNDII